MGGGKVSVNGKTASIGKRPKVIDAKDSPHYQRRGDMRPKSESEGRAMMEWHKKTREIAERGTMPKNGDIVGVRANLALIDVIKKKTGERVVVQTLHKSSAKSRDNLHAGTPGAVINYGMAFVVRNGKFRVNQQGRADIATGKAAKFPMASVDGEYVAEPDAGTMFDGVEIKFNPRSTHLFVDPDGRPVKSFGEATIVGSSVFVRGKIEYYDDSDYPLPVGSLPTTAVIASLLAAA